MADNNLGTATGEIVINTSSLGTVQSNLRQTGTILTGFGQSILGGFGAAISASADFETQISIVKAVSGETGEAIDALKEKALDLGRKGPFGPTEIASAFAELSKAGLTATEIIDGAGEAVINLGKAGDLSLPRSAEIMANVMRTFGIEAAGAAHVVDLLAGAANQSTLEVDDLGVSLKYVGGIAAGLGIPIDDVAIALAQLGNAGIKGSTGGTSLRQMLLQLDPSSKPARAALEKLGIITADGANQFFTAEGKAKSLRDVFEVLRKQTANLTDQERIHTLGIIFGNRAAAAAAILSKEGAAGYEEMAAAIGKVSAADVAADKLDNLNGSIRKFKAAIETTLIGAGSPFQDGLKSAVDLLTKIVLAFDRLPGPVKQALGILVALAGVLLIFAGGAALGGAAIINMVNVFRQLPATLSAVRNGFTLLSGAFRALSATLLANPVFLIIAAIVALGIALYILYRNSEGFRDFVDGLWQTIQVVWDKILGFFRRLPQYFEDAFNFLKRVMDDAVGWMKRNWDIILAIFTGPIGLIVLLVRRFGDDIAKFFGEALDKVVGFFSALPGRILGFVSEVTSAVLGFFASLPGRVLEFCQQTVSAFFETLSQMPFILGYLIGAMIGLTIRFAIEIVQFFWDMGNRVVATVVDFFQRLPGIIAGIFTTIVSNVAGFVESMVTSAISLGTRFIAAVVQFFTQLPGILQNFFSAAWLLAVNFVTSTVLTAIDLGQRFIAAVIQFFSQLPNILQNFFSDSWNRVVNFVTSTVASFIDLGQRVIAAVVQFFSRIPGEILAALGNVGSLLYDAGRKIMTGFLDGLKSLAGGVKDFFGGLTSGITKWKGPESRDKKLLTPAANWIMGGFIDSLEGQVAPVKAFFEGLTDNIGNLNGTVGSSLSGSGILPSVGAGSLSSVNTSKPSDTRPITINNTFTGNFQVRDDRDALNISRFLAEETRRSLRASGEQVSIGVT